MAQDATGTPTPLGIPKFDTAADAPSGVGTNAMMDAIDTLITEAKKVSVKVAGALVGRRLYVNFIEGDGVTITQADDSVGDKVDITIAATAGGGSGTPVDGWNDLTGTWVYSAADAPTYQMVASGDFTTVVGVGDRITLQQSSTDKYFIVTAIATGGGNTTITMLSSMTSGTADNSGLANAAISTPKYSKMKAPLGFPLDPLRWRVFLNDTTDHAQTNAVYSTWYSPGALSLSVPIGAWKLRFKCCFGIAGTGGGVGGYCALSTANNSASDAELKARQYDDQGTNDQRSTVELTKAVKLASKTSYYPTIMKDFGTSGNGSATFRNADVQMIIEAICTYL